MRDRPYDLCVIGGGINGAGIARDAAGRGLSVLLVEAQDLASGTSSASTKLIHGGLRYLEYYDFKLVRDALKEREILLSLAPHIIWPLEFVLPHDGRMRPYFMIRLGLYLYDWLAGSARLRRSRGLNLRKHRFGLPLNKRFRSGFSYADCWAEDSRLVALNAVDAAALGADIVTRMACTGLSAKKGLWTIDLKDQVSGKAKKARAHMVVNAAGPWAGEVLALSDLQREGTPKVRQVKGSHIIIDRVYEGDRAYILQQPDKRIVFAIPYERDYTLIGTTESPCEGDLREQRISDVEIEYLCGAFNDAFAHHITRNDVHWAYSGVRPLFEDGSDSATAATRDHRLHVEYEQGAAILSVFGGKLTTYRLVAEEVVSRVSALLGREARPWSADKVLPGGNIPDSDFEAFVREKQAQYRWLDADVVLRLARAYGTRMDMILGEAEGESDLGVHYGGGIYEAELRYGIQYEFVREVEDFLWRRSKLGLHVDEQTVRELEDALPGLLEGALADVA